MGSLACLLVEVGAPLSRIPGRAEVRRILAERGLAADKRRGQNFVVDANTVHSIVRRADVRAGESVVEIGPGLGALTHGLLEAGARVTAVEIDAGLVEALRDLLPSDVRVVHADALHVDWATLVDEPSALVANLPYNVATPLVLHALASECFTRLHVMVQREVGERWAASVGDDAYGAASVKMQAYASVRVDQRISRRAFWPVPNVDSVIMRLEPHPWQAATPRGDVIAVVDAGFAQRRKQLRNALSAAGHDPVSVTAALEDVGPGPMARAEELDLDAWVGLAARLG